MPKKLPLLAVLPVYEGDEALAVKNLELCRRFGCTREFDLLVAVDEGFDPGRIVALAKPSFRTVRRFVYPKCPWGSAWPRPANWAWQRVAEWVGNTDPRPWLWWEPDAVPVKEGWLQAIMTAYQAGGQPFGGPFEINPRWGRYMVGVAVYPPNVSRYAYYALMTQTSPFDMVLGTQDRAVFRSAELPCIQHHYRDDGEGDTFYDRADVEEAVLPTTFLYHRCNDGSLQDVLLGRNVAVDAPNWPKPWFYHSGDLGDVIYSLPTVKALGGGGTYILGPGKDHPPYKTREPMSEARANLVLPLLRRQPYIGKAVWSAKPVRVDFNLNEFRQLLFAEKFVPHIPWTLSSLVLDAFGLPHWLELEKWLEVDSVEPYRPIVVARSGRYPGFHRWQALLEKWQDQCVFVGSLDEWQAFVKTFGDVPWQPTRNLLEVAQLIEGCQLFVGNQSSPFALAEGLKKPAYLEWNADAPNCHFCRPKFWYGNWPVPSVVRKPVQPALNWHAIHESFSGLGRVSWQFLKHLSGRLDIRVVPTRMSVVPGAQLPEGIPVNRVRMPGPCLVLEALPELPKYVQPGDLVYSMWESTKVPNVETLNRAKLNIVPSKWCADCYRSSGVKTPIVKVPLGIDPAIYHPEWRQAHDGIVFGAAMRVHGDGNPRKRVEPLLEAFLAAFPDRKDVRLEVKVYDAKAVKVPGMDQRIRVFDGFWEEERLADWYRSLDVFVNLAAAGGWELHLHEAMGCGAVPMAIPYSSCLEFFVPDWGFPVDYELVDTNWGPYSGAGQWASPKPGAVEAAFRRAASVDLRERSQLATEQAHKFTWKKAADQLYQVLSAHL